jgi:hypothetical protein
MRLHKRNLILALQSHINHLSLYTAVAIAKRCTRNGAVLDEKVSFSYFLDCCSDNLTENEVAQEELNTGPTTPYQTVVFIHGGRNRKKSHSHWSCPERESVVSSLFGRLQ